MNMKKRFSTEKKTDYYLIYTLAFGIIGLILYQQQELFLSEALRKILMLYTYTKYVSTKSTKQRRYSLKESVGKVSAEFAYLYPPGIPMIVPGEQITGQFVRNVRRYMEQGLEVQEIGRAHV